MPARRPGLPARPIPAPCPLFPESAGGSPARPIPSSYLPQWEGPDGRTMLRIGTKRMLLQGVSPYRVTCSTVSSRFSISLTTMVQAASSGAGIAASRASHPQSTSSCAAAGSACSASPSSPAMLAGRSHLRRRIMREHHLAQILDSLLRLLAALARSPARARARASLHPLHDHSW